MSKLTFRSSVLCLAMAAACLPVGCASGASSDAVGSSTSALASDGGAAGSLVISQVFGGGTSAGVLNQDYVELFNPTKAAISLGGLSLQFASATSDFGEGGGDAVLALSGSVSIPAGGYYLVGLHKESGGTNLSKTPDAQGNFDLAATDGKVMLATGTDQVQASDGGGCGGQTNCSPDTYLDLLGYGSASQAEGVRLAGLDAAKSAQRKGTPAGCTDTNNNTNDFLALPPPSPARNTSTAPTPCSTGPKDAGTDGAKPVGVTDPDLPDDVDVDSGVKVDAGKSNSGAAADDSGCSVGGVGAGNISAMGLLFAAGVAVTARRRRRRA